MGNHLSLAGALAAIVEEGLPRFDGFRKEDGQRALNFNHTNQGNQGTRPHLFNVLQFSFDRCALLMCLNAELWTPRNRLCSFWLPFKAQIHTDMGSRTTLETFGLSSTPTANRAALEHGG